MVIDCGGALLSVAAADDQVDDQTLSSWGGIRPRISAQAVPW